MGVNLLLKRYVQRQTVWEPSLKEPDFHSERDVPSVGSQIHPTAKVPDLLLIKVIHVSTQL
jgi:hypothetical protein